MKKIEEVFQQLSELYEFNKKIRTYTLPPKQSVKSVGSGEPSGPKRLN